MMKLKGVKSFYESKDTEETDIHGYLDFVGTAALKEFGPSNQLVKAMEELAELQVELAKYLGDPNTNNFDAVRDEIADVRIMVNQLEMLFQRPLCEAQLRIKLYKLRQRITKKRLKQK